MCMFKKKNLSSEISANCAKPPASLTMDFLGSSGGYKKNK